MLRIDLDIGGFQIAMHDAPLVGIFTSVRDLEKNFFGFRGRDAKPVFICLPDM